MIQDSARVQDRLDAACRIEVESDLDLIKTPGTLLILFDRSGSMNEMWNNTPRYQAAGNALIEAITPLQDSLTIGGIFFPSIPEGTSDAGTCDTTDPLDWLPGGDCLNLDVIASGQSCEVTEITAPDQIDFRLANDFIAELSNHWRLEPNGAGNTPLETAMNRADEALLSANLGGTTAVVILTDGEPNCDTSPANLNSIAARWLESEIKTYVVGLPGTSAASTLLNDLAVAGGTQHFIEPNDPDALHDQIAAIVSKTIRGEINTCVILIERPSGYEQAALHMVVTDDDGKEKEVPQQLGSGSGWSVSSNGTTVTLQGALCEDAQDGRFDSIEFYLDCI